MGYTFYNRNLFDKIIKMTRKDVPASIQMFEEYLEQYPTDYSAYLQYAACLITIDDIARAEEIASFVDDNLRNTKLDNAKKRIILKELVFTKLRLLCQTGKYEEAIQHARSNKELLNEYGVNLGVVLTYCYQQLGKNNLKLSEENSYLVNQIISYDYNNFRLHIGAHFGDTDDEEQDTFFFDDFPVEKVLAEVYKAIPNSIRINGGFFDNYFYFRYDNCGKCINGFINHTKTKTTSTTSIVDYFKIVTFKGTDNIITMFPCHDSRGLPYTDLNYLREDKNLAYRKSQIDKFNEKYKKLDNK